ncbi:hypothetical protein N7495_004570 [Penicillium taxi]|uniref:uncharacterized protein n=1 Tax=Penicillium taxi TaxID=168475 RepID=UPI00254514DC|nr:uncharacterized protein N7495_004570 [Penicillium taxi]KAJ5899826.1 hypothetical protein N7495_004570 [Penicillium taxi]
MALHNSQLRSLPSRLFGISRQQVRTVTKKANPVPLPTPFVPDAQTFLTLIGRGMSKHASKFETWDTLFSSDSSKLREMGIEPARARRYLIQKRQKFIAGIHGPGGDLDHVVDGAGELRVVEVPQEYKKPTAAEGELATGQNSAIVSSASLTPGMVKVLVNMPLGIKYHHDPSKPLKYFNSMKIRLGKVQGPFLNPVKGSHGTAARISVQEGMWEDKRGHKVDGGERRQTEVRAKKWLEERRNA